MKLALDNSSPFGKLLPLDGYGLTKVLYKGRVDSACLTWYDFEPNFLYRKIVYIHTLSVLTCYFF